VKFLVLLYRRCHWLNLPGAVLVALLQRTPLVRVATVAEEAIVASPVAAVLRSMLTAAASLGAVHALAGATTMSVSSGSTTGVSVAAGTSLTIAMGTIGTDTQPLSWQITGPFPPGLSFSSGSNTLTSAGTINTPNGVLLLSGTPTTPGTYALQMTAYEGANLTLTPSGPPPYSYTITVTGTATAVAPTITTQPQNQTVNAGGSVTFTAAASGTPTPTFQWKKNGTAVSGATSASLTLSNVQSADAGGYTITATNSAGSATSSAATLTVNAGSSPTFTTQPQSQTVNAGASVTFTAAASGSPTPTYQWLKNSTAISGATNASLTLTNVQTTDAGVFSVAATNSAGSATSALATLTVNASSATAPSFTLQPGGQTIATGSTVVFTAAASGSPTPTYQWKRDGATLSGATNATLVVSGAAAVSGAYTCVATNSAGSATSSAANLSVSSTSDIGRLTNLSIRTNAGTADQTLIVGFAVGGANGTKPLLVRGIGPSLAQFGLTGVLADPVETMISGSTTIATNDNWGGDAQISARATQVGAFALATNSLDSSLAVSPATGGYTVQITGKNNGTGIALAEIYDASSGTFSIATTPRLTNVSARTQVGTGDNILIAGFVIGGSTSRTVLIRATGPALTKFGVGGVLVDPKLQLYSGNTVIRENDDWGADAQLSAVGDSVGAFTLGTVATKDSVLLVTLPAGAYTAQVSGVNSTSGVALIEVYEVP
jgi:hypothetical protein